MLVQIGDGRERVAARKVPVPELSPGGPRARRRHHHQACIDTKDRACVDVCPVQCIYEYDSASNTLFAEDEAGSGVVENTHAPAHDQVVVFGDTMLYVNTEECTSCTACYQPDVCPVGAIYPEEDVPDGSPGSKYNADDPAAGHDHSFFVGHSRAVFAD